MRMAFDHMREPVFRLCLTAEVEIRKYVEAITYLWRETYSLKAVTFVVVGYMILKYLADTAYGDALLGRW